MRASFDMKRRGFVGALLGGFAAALGLRVKPKPRPVIAPVGTQRMVVGFVTPELFGGQITHVEVWRGAPGTPAVRAARYLRRSR